MTNFQYYTPTRLVFGKNSIEELPSLLKPLGKRVLLTYGGGSIKKIGLYDKVKELLKDFEVYELGGIEPNPKYDPSVLEGRKICIEHNIEVVLAVGGGSVVDCSKAICGVAANEGDAWDIIRGKIPTKKALPLVDIITLAATGSEYDDGCVISKSDTNDKIGYNSEFLFPVASILDPTYTFSVSKYQTAAGVADAINHVLEQFFCKEHTKLTDDMCVAVINSLIENGKKALVNPEDYEARSEIMVCCSLACNGILSLGNSSSGWPMHGIEHELSGFYDITHGVGLAIITPRWMKKILSDETLERFIYLGKKVFGLEGEGKEVANKVIEAFYNLFEKDLHIPMHLKEVGINEDRIEEMVEHLFLLPRMSYLYVPLSKDDVTQILKESL